MTREEAIKNIKEHCYFANLIPRAKEALDMAIKVLEQKPCDDDYIKVPKKVLKYKDEDIVAYNYEWLKEHFDIERKVILGDSEPFINKPCIAHQICHEDKVKVLDKIRTEIDNINLNEVALKYENRFYGFQREVIKIIDKYKESEE